MVLFDGSDQNLEYLRTFDKLEGKRTESSINQNPAGRVARNMMPTGVSIPWSFK